jgi:hypothetical protein
MSDSKEENTSNKKANTSSTPMITDTPKQQPNKVIQKASSFAIAHPTPFIPMEAKLGSSLDSVLGLSSTATSEDSMEVVATSNPSSRVNTPNKVRFGAAAASGLKPPSGPSTASAKTTKTSGISCLAKAKTQTPTKTKK